MAKPRRAPATHQIKKVTAPRVITSASCYTAHSRTCLSTPSASPRSSEEVQAWIPMESELVQASYYRHMTNVDCTTSVRSQRSQVAGLHYHLRHVMLVQELDDRLRVSVVVAAGEGIDDTPPVQEGRAFK